METIDFSRFIFSFLFVIGLIGGFGYLLKRYASKHKFMGITDSAGRLSIVETRYLDPRRKLMLVKRDNVEHLLLLSDGREIVIESNIKAADNQSHG